MAGFGQVGFSQTNKLGRPSDSIWGDCPSVDLMRGEQGFLDFKDFKAALPSTAAPDWAIDSGSFVYSTAYDSVVNMTSGGSDQDDIAIATRPMGPIVAGSGQKFWFEAEVNSAVITLARGVFVGIANLAALGSKLLISAVSATKNSNLIGTSSGGQSLYGFWLHGDALTNYDAVWANNITTALTPTTIGTNLPTGTGTGATGAGIILASVLTSPANNPNPANVNYVPQTPPGLMIATVTANQTVAGQSLTPQYLLDNADPSSNPQTFLPNAAVGATGFVKLGLRYDGLQYLYFYVNGNQVAKMVISASQDQTSDFGGVVQLMSGTAAAKVENVAFMRTAALINP